MIDTLFKVFSNPVLIFVTGWTFGVWTAIVIRYIFRKW